MSLEFSNFPTVEPGAAALTGPESPVQRGPRVEPCEFEQLLQRAMEILNARDLQAQLTAKPS